MTVLIYQDARGEHITDGGESFLKSIGVVQPRNLIMTDEDGTVVGAGDSLGTLHRSVPLIKAIRESEPNKAVPMRKSMKPGRVMAKSYGSLNAVYAELKSMARAKGLV